MKERDGKEAREGRGREREGGRGREGERERERELEREKGEVCVHIHLVRSVKVINNLHCTASNLHCTASNDASLHTITSHIANSVCSTLFLNKAYRTL